MVGVRERQILIKWALRGVSRVGEHSVRDKVQLVEGRPIDPAAVTRARGRIDSLYRADGYYLAQVKVVTVYEADSSRVRVIFDVDEGRRVAIAQLTVEGNTHFSDADLVGQMKTGPEGFWWFRSGDYDDDKLRADLQEHLPKFYGDRGYVDFQVLGDTLVVDDTTGKATLDRKSTRLNSSHSQISYAVFCLKKKKKVYTLSCLFSFAHAVYHSIYDNTSTPAYSECIPATAMW